MKCERPTGVQIYRYTEQLFGLGTTTYEIRTEGQWVPICTPSEKSWAWDEKTKAYSATKCVPGDKAITKKELSRLGNLPWQTVTTGLCNAFTQTPDYGACGLHAMQTL